MSKISFFLGFTLIACGGSPDEAFHHSDYSSAIFASEVIRFEPGEGAGFGMTELPDIVLGPPRGTGISAGSLDVVSLGKGGEIVLGFGEHRLQDGEGADFYVFENAFWANGQADAVWADPAEISVSSDGQQWHSFTCASEGDGLGNYPGCAGWRPVMSFELSENFVFSSENVGGGAFDLAELSVTEARFIRIRDLAGKGEGPSAGFDLDAVAGVHFK